jgi:hypothetical protein
MVNFFFQSSRTSCTCSWPIFSWASKLSICSTSLKSPSKKWVSSWWTRTAQPSYIQIESLACMALKLLQSQENGCLTEQFPSPLSFSLVFEVPRALSLQRNSLWEQILPRKA